MSNSIEQRVAGHYAHGTLERSILDALKEAGKDPDHLALADLAPVDEFHIGGRRATIDFAAQLEIEPDWHLLDIGCGLGGASRYFAHECACRVMGIDLSDEYVRVAEVLARRVGLDRRVSYRCGSALALPFAPSTFDGAYMLHVGMNIADKSALFAEIRRLLRPGGVFGIYDVMRESQGEMSFPVPWASSAETSFVESAATYRELLEAAGFEVRKERSRRDFAIDFFRQMRARAAQSEGPPPVGLHILMGSAWPRKVENMIGNLEGGLIAPTEIVCRASSPA
jgi:ubiquinone/menaquinone biosynthesis C-methylase UbiE